MGFLDKAKAAANDLAAKADTAINSGLASSGVSTPGGATAPPAPPAAPTSEAERLLRDLGVLAYLEANGRPAPSEDRERVLAALRRLESTGAMREISLSTGAVTPPPPASPAPAAPAPQAPVPPPPPPSWAKTDESST